MSDETRPTDPRDASVPPATSAASDSVSGDLADAADNAPPPSPEELMASIPEPMPPTGVSRASARRWFLPKHGASRTPQGLMLLWCLWLLATWVIVILGNTGLPPIRWMILSAMLGLTLAWPLLRLMQELPSTGSAEASPRTTRVRLPDALRDADSSATSSAHAGVGGDAAASCDISKPRAWDVMRLILRDWLAMILVFQVVVWPLRLTAMWSTGQAIVLDGSVAAWSLLVGAIIAWGCMGDRPSRRTLAMVAIVLLLFGEPLAMAIININATRGQGITWPMRVSPLETVWLSTGAPADWIGAPWIERTIAAGVAAVLAWAALGISQWFLPSNNVPAVTNELP